MRRRLFNLAVALSLVACVGVCALWGWSYPRGRVIWHVRPGDEFRFTAWQAQARHRKLVIDAVAGQAYHPLPPPGFGRGDDPPFPEHTTLPDVAFGFGYRRTHYSAPFYDEARDTCVVPLAFLAGLAGVMPVAWVMTRGARTRRRMEGRCPTCGYDLRATPGRCSECGAVAIPPRRGRAEGEDADSSEC